MPQQPQYLSTDPNAGRASGDGYLSTDPNAGAAKTETPEPKSGAAARFAGGAWEMLNPVSMVKGAVDAVSHPIDTAKNIYESHVTQAQKAFENAGQGRYSEAIGHGAAALLPILGPAAANIGEEIGTGEDIAGGLGKAAGLLTGTLTPKAITKPIAKATEYGTAAAMRPLTTPGRGLIRQQRAPLEMERTALKTGSVTKGAAMRKMKAAAAETTKKVDDATQAGTLIDRSSVATFPKTLDKVTNLTPNIDELDDLAKLEADTIATLPAKITPSELLKRRRGLDESVDAAYRAEERHGQIRGTKDKGKKELAGNMRGELRKVADIAESDDLARRQMLVAKMWQDIGERSKTVPMSAALAGAGAASLGIPGAGPIGASMAIGRTWPQIPMAIGSVPVRATGAAINPELLRAALIAHLTGQQE
jgi:hypothetical protein